MDGLCSSGFRAAELDLALAEICSGLSKDGVEPVSGGRESGFIQSSGDESEGDGEENTHIDDSGGSQRWAGFANCRKLDTPRGAGLALNRRA